MQSDIKANDSKHITQILFDPSGGILVTCDELGNIMQWDPDTGEKKASILLGRLVVCFVLAQMEGISCLR